ncbi:uncharacterized protein LOC121848556 isoform X2 [Callorhinchus milii]|uniref:uncharacterized protein LOC121848556 isoform X2 n=1 Tax=Callorhinchus milii TaxID=7868 RepID=UPI001C3F9807|nr:uncharacterized protein LOC121848556 isoform X2 [Callorhinchus milii]
MSTTLSKIEGKFRDEVMPHFIEGIKSMEAFVTLALRMGTAILSDSECSEIMKVIGVAYEEMEVAESEVLAIVKSLNQDFEESTLEISRMKAEKERLQETVRSTKKELESAEHQRDLERQHLQTAEKYLAQAKAILRREQQKQQEAETIRNVGIGLMFIPIIGLIIGSPMVGVGQEDLNNANSSVQSATSNCDSQRSKLQESERQLECCRQQVAVKRNELAGVKSLLTQQQQDLEMKRNLYTKLSDVLTVLKRCAQYLCTVHGRVTVLRVQSQHLYCMEPLIVIIEEIVSSVDKLPTSMRLSDSGPAVAKSITNLKETCSRMKAICSE